MKNVCLLAASATGRGCVMCKMMTTTTAQAAAVGAGNGAKCQCDVSDDVCWFGLLSVKELCKIFPLW